MRLGSALTQLAIGVTAGAVATRLTGPIQVGLYRGTPQRVRKREEAVRPGGPPKIAAEKTAHAVGVEPTQSEKSALAQTLHYGSGIA